MTSNDMRERFALARCPGLFLRQMPGTYQAPTARLRLLVRYLAQGRTLEQAREHLRARLSTLRVLHIMGQEWIPADRTE